MADAHHHDRLLSFSRILMDYARVDGGDVVTWDAEGWIGGDRHKFWWKTEGDHSNGSTERAEFQALYSRNVWTFFDVQAGLRHDRAPGRPVFAAIGVQGLAPYLLDTELHVFIATAGDVHLRARQAFDLLVSNRFIVTPQFETDFFLSDAADRGIASGFSRIETGVQARYEISRKFAPTLALVYDSKLGGTRDLAEAAGDDAGGWRLSAGLRIWF
jgi:copper resistance protein B